MKITFYAGAADAAGTATRTLEGPLTANQLREALGRDNERLAVVLSRCSLLADGVHVSEDDLVPAGAAVDVLPPFAGG
ncbi:MAG: MoaD/ThiS family protein [Propioniciclava sp.]